MSRVLKVSEAASLALHAVVLLAERPERTLSTREIASVLHVSEFHLSKVLQRLSKAGLVSAVRGPRGGFLLGKDPEKITLLEVYEEIEGPLLASDCLMSTRICRGKRCILGGLLKMVNKEVRNYLSRTNLSELKGVYQLKRVE
jgi:Rrf2 family protein